MVALSVALALLAASITFLAFVLLTLQCRK